MPELCRFYGIRGNAKDKLGRIDEAWQDFEKARDLAHKANDGKLVVLAGQALRKLDSQEGE